MFVGKPFPKKMKAKTENELRISMWLPASKGFPTSLQSPVRPDNPYFPNIPSWFHLGTSPALLPILSLNREGMLTLWGPSSHAYV